MPDVSVRDDSWQKKKRKNITHSSHSLILWKAMKWKKTLEVEIKIKIKQSNVEELQKCTHCNGLVV